MTILDENSPNCQQPEQSNGATAMSGVKIENPELKKWEEMSSFIDGFIALGEYSLINQETLKDLKKTS